MDTRVRLWRARRRHVHIDAMLERGPRSCVLVFLRNDRHLAALEYPNERSARSAARARLRELERVGWIDHW
ncbi:MAG TPA: hypothetical protein VFV78_04890 [Vicinamibacterales bacterium]|nr:hypothetical protein [Vicinamibacterales bacterium]